MNNNDNSNKLDIRNFFKIYPEIVHRSEREDIHKYLKIFQKPIKTKEKEQQIPDLNRSLKNKEKSSRRYSLNESLINKKKFISLSISKRKSIDSFDINENNDKNEKIIEENFKSEYYLIQKAIYLQKHNKKRTEDIKEALGIFLYNSKFIEKITSNLNIIEPKIKKSILLQKNEKSEEKEEDIKSKIENKLNEIISKLSEKLVIKKYGKNKFIAKMNESGEDCFFLLSGKVSILKPVEYQNIKLSYKEYFIYLKSLLDLKETDLLLKVLKMNKKYLDITNINEITILIKVYFVSTFKKELDTKINGISLNEVESYFKEFNYSFEDFELNKEKMLKEIDNIREVDSNYNILLKNYIYDNIYISKEDLFLLDVHNIFNLEKEKKYILVSLYRYEIFLYLYPGSFFGDAALENKSKKRNATIRTEEDCIICLLNNEYYLSLIHEENKKLKIMDLQFVCNNYFFNKISPTIFNKYYYPMFKLSEKKKQDIIYKYNDNLSSVYLLKDGIIKTEINVNLSDLILLIKNIIKALYIKSNNLKLNLEQIMQLKKTYLKDDIKLENMKNKEDILSLNKTKQIYNLFYSNGSECLGILEFCLDLKYLTTCSVVSDKAIFMEIKKEDLSRILKIEKEILSSYYNYVFNNAFSLTKRLYFLKTNLLNKVIHQFQERIINKNKYIFTTNKKKENNNHKQKVKIIHPDYIKSFYNKIIKTKISRSSVRNLASNTNNSQKSDLISTNLRRDLSRLNDKVIIKDNSLQIKENLNMTNTFYSIKKKGIIKDKKIENEKHYEVINIKNKILSINSIKENILKEYYKKKNFEKLNIVSNFQNEDERPLFENKYLEEKDHSLGYEEDSYQYDKSKDTIYNSLNTIKKNEDRTNRKDNSFISNLPNIKSANRKLKNLMKKMKQKQCINSGQKKFIFYRKSKDNKVYNNLVIENKSISLRQKSPCDIIKKYYLRKKIKGYSSIINPLNNTYINRQKTVRVRSNISF